MQTAARPVQPADPILTELRVARKVMDLRRESGLTLRELGERCGLSEAYLSRVENQRTAISIANLSRIAEVFATPIAAFFEEEADRNPLTVCRSGDGRVVRLRGRNGVRVVLLADKKKGKLMEPILVDVSSARPGMKAQSHNGEEFIHVLEGCCRFDFGKETIELGPGDSIYFDSSVEHGVVALEGEKCRLVAVVASPDYRHHGDISRLMEE